jgi:aminoglycoside phosphotransferase (APT) family kinase protein
VTEPRRLSGGREADIIDLGDGTVLRQYKGVGHPEREGMVIEHARRHGFPVPRVVEIQENALVLERVDGPTMARDILQRPWRGRRHIRLLAALHRRLHEIEAPPALPVAGPGDRLIHLDFHPENVLMSPRGPVVIDWTNARRGEPALDVAMTWVICATSGGPFARLIVRPYRRPFDLAEIRRALPAAAERRIADPNVTERERRAVRRLVERETRPGAR